MSFFDEVDEPDEPRRPERTAPRRPRQTGRGGRPPGRPPIDQQVQTRRIIAVVVVIVIVLVMALLIHGCESNQTLSSLRDYTASVNSLIRSSDNTGAATFRQLRSAGSSGAGTVQTDLNNDLHSAESQLSHAEGLSVPGQMATAQRNLVLALTMRRDGLSLIAKNIQEALSSTTAQDGVNKITLAASYFYGSDVVYKGYVGPEIAGALHGAGIAVGNGSAVTINPGQFLTDLGWLNKTNVAAWVGAKLPTSVANPVTPGVHGHSLNSVSSGSTTLSTTSTTTLPANPAPTFQLNITNGGTTPEYDVVCEVQVIGLSDTGTSTIAETTAGQTTDCAVTLPSPPTPGTYRVKAEVQPVPGEKNKANNTLTFPVTFTS